MISASNDERIIEAYIGEYASGKSEMAINRAMELANRGDKVTLVDLDTVEPFYTLRPIKKELEEEGIRVIGLSNDEVFGLGETGAMLNPAARWALRQEGHVIFDVGYGVHGARTLNLVEGAYESLELRIIAVINYTRPMTASPQRIKEYIIGLGRVDAIVANSHLGDETTLELVEQGNSVIFQVAREMGIPVCYMAMDESLKNLVNTNRFSVPVKFIKRFMTRTMWN